MTARSFHCFRELDPVEFAAWDVTYQEAKTAMSNRTDKLDQVAERIERDLIVLGATAIEDKLQQVRGCTRLIHD